MNSTIKTIIVFIIIIALVYGGLWLCSLQSCTRSMGGSTTVDLEPGQKLELITWKNDDLWYLTRPMREDDIAETHTYQEQANLGILEGTVTIIEHK